MKIYYRYVLGGVTKLFVTTLLIFTVALLFLLVVQMSLKTGFPFTYSFRLTPYLVPEIFAIAIPASALFAVTIFFAKMGGNNEIIGLKSLGIAPWRILYPVWILMFGVSVCGVWFNDLSTSWTRLEMNRVLLEGVETMLLSQLRTENRFVAP
ncbi:MAG: LptF/LptG family permease, partial [Thermoguttaceae bacterium]|nr:LptF/LptG family permease [Thermoguttaceae bacterium]